MKKPEIEVVRFGAEDVIATSALNVTRNYFTTGKELNQAKAHQQADDFVYTDTKIYWFSNGNPNSYYGVTVPSSELNGTDAYAWFNTRDDVLGWATYHENDYNWYKNNHPEYFTDTAKFWSGYDKTN